MATSEFLGKFLLIGYARVSTTEQDTALQIDALAAAGVGRIYEEAASGVADRPELEKLLNDLRPGDIVVVWKLDRLARSLSDLLRIVSHIREVGAQIRSLNEPLDTSSPLGLFVLQVLGAVAELERNMIRQRCAAGIAAAKKRGVKLGRRKHPLRSQEIDNQIKNRYESGESFRSIARSLGVNESTIRCWFKNPLNSVENQ